MAHRVCIASCVKCGFEKVLNNPQDDSIERFECSKCGTKNKVGKKQKCFVFRGVKPVNIKNKIAQVVS
ncbi:hypothetical protein OAN96_00845 [Candidatus Gracilibacteria bacterium]|nr:hypothetical protein [Candidatus Gracilibacteria bacterium]